MSKETQASIELLYGQGFQMSSLENGPQLLAHSEQSSDEEGSSTQVSLLDSYNLNRKQSEYEDVPDPEMKGVKKRKMDSVDYGNHMVTFNNYYTSFTLIIQEDQVNDVSSSDYHSEQVRERC